MGQVADTSLAALRQELRQTRYPLWWQRYLFGRKARGTHGVHSPLAYALAVEIWMQPNGQPLLERLHHHLEGYHFTAISLPNIHAGMAQLPEGKKAALLVTDTLADRPKWLHHCTDKRVSMAIDCFDFGLLIHNTEIRQQQYLRQRYRCRL